MAIQTATASASQSDRVPPYNEDAERALLGSALLDAARVVDLCVENGIVPEAFYVFANQVVYETLLDMGRENKPIDLITVSERLEASGRLQQVGGSQYLDQLVDQTPTAAHVEYYLTLVKQKFLLRRVIEESRDAIQNCYTSEDDADIILSNAEQAIFELSHLQKRSMLPWNELVNDAMHEIETIYQTKRGLTGIPTGYADLDKILMGMHNSDMLILAARPSMGKTSLALNIAEHVATARTGDMDARPVAVFSLEMSSDQLVRRMLCSHAKVPSHKLYGGYLNDVNHGHLIQAADSLMKAPIYLDDTAGLSALELRSRARRLKRKYDIQFVVIDYLQMMNYPQFARDGRQRETAAISGAVKAMAKELKVPVLVLSQLSRSPETRDRKAVPRLSDLRDSGSIEQDADVVMLLRRPGKYPEDPRKDEEGLAILDVAKHRNGPVGEVDLYFAEDYTRFENGKKGGVDREPPEDFDPTAGGFGE